MSAPERIDHAAASASPAAETVQEPVRRRSRSGPPAETTFLFVLLVITVTLACSTFLSTLLTPPAEARQQAQTFVECASRMQGRTTAESPAGPADMHTLIGMYHEELRNIATLQECLAPAKRRQLMHQLGGLGLVFGTGVLLYLAHPAWYRRRRRLCPLPADEAADLLAELERLRRLAGVKPVRFALQPFNAVPSAFVHGLPRRRTLALSTGLLVRYRTDPEAFRAVVLHELAHLRNRDIEPTYLALTLTAALGLVLGTYSVSYLRHPGPLGFMVTGPLPQALLLGLLALLLLAALVRSREFQADARVTEWEGDRTALPRVLRDMPVPPRRALSGLRTLHPTPARRAARLSGTSLPFGLGYWGGVGLGLTAMVTLTDLRGLSALGSFVVVPVWMSAVPGILVAAVVVVGRWRYESAHPGGAPVRMLPFGLGLATGTAFGPLASPSSFLLREEGSDLLRWVPGWVLFVVLVTVPVHGLTAEAVACWHRMTARSTPSASRRHMPGALLIAVAVASVGYTYLSQVVAMGQSLVGLDDNPLLDMVGFVSELNGPVMAVSLVVASGLPTVLLGMAAAMVLLTVVTVIWQRFHAPSPPSAPPGAPLWRRVLPGPARSAVRIGLVGTALLMSFLSLTGVLAHRLPLAERWHSDFFARFYFSQLAAAVVAVALTALVAVARARRRPPAAGVLAALVCLAAAIPVVVGQGLLGNCVDALEGPFSRRACIAPPSAAYVWTVVQILVGWTGAAVALLVPPCAALRDRTLRKRADAGETPSVPASPVIRFGRSPWGRTALALTTAAALSLGASAFVDESRFDPARLAGTALGDDGWVDGGDFRVQMAPGWYDTTAGSGAGTGAVQGPERRQLRLEKPGFGQRAVLVVGRTTALPIDRTTPDVLAEGGRRTKVAGHRALVADSPGNDRHIVLIEVGKEQLRLQLTDFPTNMEDTKDNLDAMLATWQWTGATGN